MDWVNDGIAFYNYECNSNSRTNFLNRYTNNTRETFFKTEIKHILQINYSLVLFYFTIAT